MLAYTKEAVKSTKRGELGTILREFIERIETTEDANMGRSELAQTNEWLQSIVFNSSGTETNIRNHMKKIALPGYHVCCYRKIGNMCKNLKNEEWTDGTKMIIV